MPRIPYPNLDTASPEVRDMLGRLPAPANIFNMMAHAETLLKPVMKLGGSMLGKMQLDPLLREFVILHSAKLAHGEYEWVQHVPIAHDLGGTEAQTKALERGDEADASFTPAQTAALRLTRELVLDGRGSEATLAAARAHFSDREIVELILTCGFYVMLARFTETLGIEPEPPMGSALIRRIEQRVGTRKT